MPTPEDIYAFLQSQRGQSLGAGDYNSLSGAYQNAYNARSAATPGPWQASYYGGGATAQPQVETFTGKESQNVGYDNGLALALSRQYFTPNATPSFGRAGNELHINGQTVTNNLLADASGAGVSPDDYTQRLVQQYQQAQPAFSMRNALTSAQNDPRLQALTGIQRNATLTAAAGVNPLNYDEMERKNLEAAIKLQQDRQGLENSRLANQKTQQDIYQQGAKGFHPNATPEDIFTTYNTDPAHPNQFKVAGGFRPDPNSPGGFVQTPDQWQWAQPEHVEAFRRSAPQGYNTPLSSTQLAQMAARRAELLQRAQVSAAATAPAEVVSPYQSGQRFMSEVGNAPGNVYDSVANWMSTAQSNVDRKANNAVDWMHGFLGTTRTPPPIGPLPRMSEAEMRRARAALAD